MICCYHLLCTVSVNYSNCFEDKVLPGYLEDAVNIKHIITLLQSCPVFMWVYFIDTGRKPHKRVYCVSSSSHNNAYNLKQWVTVAKEAFT